MAQPMMTTEDCFRKGFRVCWPKMNFFFYFVYINCASKIRARASNDICGLLFVLIERALHNAKRFQINFDFDNISTSGEQEK